MKLFQHEGGPLWIPHKSLEDAHFAAGKARDEAMKAHQKAYEGPVAKPSKEPTAGRATGWSSCAKT